MGEKERILFVSVWVRADLVKERGELYPPLLVPGGAVAQVHQVLHLLHRLDGGHLQNHSQSDTSSRYPTRFTMPEKSFGVEGL